MPAQESGDLVKELDSSDHFAIQRALQRLAEAEPGERRAEVAQAIEKHLSHTEWFVRQAAARALRKWGGQENVPAFMQALRDRDFVVRNEAIAALAKSPSARSAEAVVSVYAENKMAAKAALMEMGPVAEEAVQALLQHKDWPIQLDACQILAKIGTAKSLPALEGMAPRANPLVARAVAQAIEEIRKRPPSDEATTPPAPPGAAGDASPPRAKTGGDEMPSRLAPPATIQPHAAENRGVPASGTPPPGALSRPAMRGDGA